MTETLWRIWRHKKRPEIRYYVETEPTPGLEWHYPDGTRRFYEISHEPEPVRYLNCREREDAFSAGLVRLRCTRNVLHDDTDYPPHVAPEAGMWPRKQFEALYEPEEGAA